MATSPLIRQIAERTTSFIRNTGISRIHLCRYLDVSESSFSQFLAGTKGLDPSIIIRLCQTLGLSRLEIEAKFNTPARSSQILHLQESVEGQPSRMQMDDSGGSWVPGLAGIDPSINGTIVDPDDGPTDAVSTCCARSGASIERR